MLFFLNYIFAVTYFSVSFTCFLPEYEDHFSSGSYDRSYDQSFDRSADQHSYRHSKSYSVSFAVNEKSLLLSGQKPTKPDYKSQEKNEKFVNVSVYKRENHGTSITQSIAYLSHLSRSSYFGFDSTAYSVAKEKEEIWHTKTISLIDQPSLDRKTPSAIYFFTILNMVTGLTIFPMPYYISRCGIPMILVCIATGALCIYTTILINRCQYQQSKDGSRKRIYTSYVDLGKATISWHGDKIMQIVVGSNVLVNIYLLIFCARVTVDLFQSVLNLDIRIWMAIWMGIVYPMFLIRKMSIIAWFGFFGLLFYTTAFGISIAELVLEFKDFVPANLSPKFAVNDFFIGYGIVLNSFSYHLALPSLEASMKHPTQFNVLSSSVLVLNTILKVAYGVLGASVYGLATQPSILSNFQASALIIVMNAMIAFSMYSFFLPSAFVVFDMMDSMFLTKFSNKGKYHEYAWLLMSRLLVATFLLFAAVVIPKFELVTSFVGQIRGSVTSIVLPIYFYLKLKKRHLTTFSIVMHLSLVMIACLLASVGTVYSVIGMFS